MAEARNKTKTQNKKPSMKLGFFGYFHTAEFFGAADRNRTGDLRITNALLYRLSYSGSTPGNPDEEPYSSKQPDKLASPTRQFHMEFAK